MLLAALILIAEGLIVSGFSFTLFSRQQWNWTGKSVSLVAAILFINYNSILSKKAAGFTSSLKVSSIYSVLGFSGILLFLRLIPKIISSSFQYFNDFETFAFEATLPGLSEELIY